MMSSAITEQIKLLGEDYENGSELINLMNYYNVTGLQYISEEQAQFYYKMILKRKKFEVHSMSKTKEAEWRYDPFDFTTYCSRCKYIPRTTTWNCPNCGSKMTNMPEREEKPMSRPIPKQGQLYKHFKGGLYKVICIAKHTETLEVDVVYRCVSPGHNTNFPDAKTGDRYVRPLDMFMSEVDYEKYPQYKGEEPKYRMTLIQDGKPRRSDLV